MEETYLLVFGIRVLVRLWHLCCVHIFYCPFEHLNFDIMKTVVSQPKDYSWLELGEFSEVIHEEPREVKGMVASIRTR